MSKLIAGLDEVGMGCLAGPVVIVIAAFPDDMRRPTGVRDSKKMTKNQRAKAAPMIANLASFVGIGFTSNRLIDKHGLAFCWQWAAKMAHKKMPAVQELVVDGNRGVAGYTGKQNVRPKADATHWQVSAASVLAKVLRDDMMNDLAAAALFKMYGWERNSGYGTPDHIEAIKEFGPSFYHRMTFIKKWI